MTAPGRVAFAIPGDIDQRTGGTIYDLRVVEALRAQGWAARMLSLAGAFPHPSKAAMEATFALLHTVPNEEALIVDGLAYAGFDTERLKLWGRKPFVMVHHPAGLEPGLSRRLADMLMARERANLALAAHVFVPSQHTAAILTERFGVPQMRISVARPGFENRPMPGGHKASPPLILAVGLLAARKGHDILLEALSALKDLPWQAVIAGRPHEPDTASALQGILDGEGLSGRVRLAGEVPDDELARLYGAASIFALATRYEGYGIVFGEAMRAGLPIVSCRVGAVPDTVPADAGLLVAADDAPAFAQTLRRLLAEPPLRRAMADASGQAGRALPGWSDTAKRFAAVLSAVTGSGGEPPRPGDAQHDAEGR